MPDAGGFGIGGFDAAAEAETTRATMESMMDSITTLQNQIAAFMEDPDVFIQRAHNASLGEQGPVIRELRYAHAQDYDRVRMSRMEEQMNQHDLRMNDLESSQGYITGELTTVNETIGTMSNTITTLRVPGNSVTALPFVTANSNHEGTPSGEVDLEWPEVSSPEDARSGNRESPFLKWGSPPRAQSLTPVSYTHLTLPTICSV